MYKQLSQRCWRCVVNENFMLKQLSGRFPYLLFRKTKSGKIIGEIDGMRFLAILPVVLQHLSERLIRNFPETFSRPIHENFWAFAVSRGSIGVLLFFAISGFVLSLPFIKIAQKKRNWSYRDYLYRRITRIEPPYLIWMSIFFVVLLIKGTYPFSELLEHYAASIFYLHNLIYDDFSMINPVAWSLEIEIQFYLIAPFIVLLFFKIERDKIRQVCMLVVILLFISLQHAMDWQYVPYKFTLLGQFQHFLAGILLADMYLNNSQRWTRNHLWDLLGVCSFVIMMYTWTEEYLKSVVFFFALCTLIISGFRGKILGNFFSKPWIVALGGMCYSIYLIHLPLLELLIIFSRNIHLTHSYLINFFIQSAILLPIIALISIIAYLLLERPFMDKTWPSRFWKFLKNSPKYIERIMVHTSRKLLVLFILTSLSLSTAYTQTFEGPRSEWPDKQLAPLEVLIDRAINRAYELKLADKVIEAQKYELKQSQRSFLNNVRVGAGLNYGNGNVVTQNGSGVDQTFVLQNRQSLQYNAGFSVGLSLGELLNRKSNIQMKQIEIDKAYIDKEQIMDNIRQEVIGRYQKVILAIRILEAMLESKETGSLTFAVADKYFKEGQMPIEAYTQALDAKANRVLTLEKARLECVIALYELKEVVGQDIY